jgi:hypothetical protein
MKTSIAAILAVSFGTCSAAGQTRDASMTAIAGFITTWGLPIDVQDGWRLKPMGTRTVPGAGRVRRVALEGHVFDVSSNGNVVGFGAARPWPSPCEVSAATEEPAVLVRQRLSGVVQRWARGVEIVRGKSWIPELQSDRGHVTVVLREASGLIEGKAAYRNHAQAVFDAGRCLVALSVSNGAVTRSVSGAITKQAALARVNAWLAKRSTMKAMDAALEVQFVGGRAVLVWVPEQFVDGDLAVAASVWVDARSGHTYRAPAVPEPVPFDAPVRE